MAQNGNLIQFHNLHCYNSAIQLIKEVCGVIHSTHIKFLIIYDMKFYFI